MTLAQTPLDKAISPSLDTCTDTENVHTGFRGSYSAQCQYSENWPIWSLMTSVIF